MRHCVSRNHTDAHHARVEIRRRGYATAVEFLNGWRGLGPGPTAAELTGGQHRCPFNKPVT